MESDFQCLKRCSPALCSTTMITVPGPTKGGAFCVTAAMLLPVRGLHLLVYVYNKVKYFSLDRRYIFYCGSWLIRKKKNKSEVTLLCIFLAMLCGLWDLDSLTRD